MEESSTKGEDTVRWDRRLANVDRRFMAQKKLQLTNAQWQKLLRQIAVEVFSLQKQGRNVLEVCNEEPTASQEALMGKIRLVDFTEVELPGEESQSMRKVDVQDPMIKLAVSLLFLLSTYITNQDLSRSSNAPCNSPANASPTLTSPRPRASKTSTMPSRSRRRLRS